MTKRVWTLLIVLVVLGGLIGGYFWLTRPRPAPKATTETKVDLSKGESDKLVKVVLADRSEGTLTLVKKAPAAAGGKTAGGTAPQKPDSAALWSFDPPAPEVYKLDSSSLDDLLSNFTSLQDERVIDANPTDLAQYGLKPPRAVAIGTFSDGSAHTLYLGNKTPANNTYYFQVKGDPKVYTVWMNVGEHFHWKQNDLRAKTLTPAINYDEVTYLKLTEKDGTVIELKEKTEAETKSYQMGFGKYIVTRPYPVPRGLDSEKGDPLVKGPQAISIAAYVDDYPKDLSKYGLARPSGEVLVRDKANSIDFLLGGDAGNSQTYAMIKGTPTVFTVDTSSLSFMSTKPFDIIDKFVFIPNIDDVDAVAITAGGKTHTLTITRTTKKAAKAGEPDEVVAAYAADGKTVEEDSFKKFYQVMIGLQIEGQVDRKVPDAPVISTRFTLNKGGARSAVIDYAPYNEDFYAAFLNGVNIFALTKGQLATMLGKLDQLVKGEKVTD
jgi:hypothetical protein